MKHRGPGVLAIVLLASGALFSSSRSLVGRSSAHDAEQSPEDRIETGTIYADNFYVFYLNGEKIAEDARFLPHEATRVAFANVSGSAVYAVLARDNADPVTGLEYGDRCVGDGGLRAVFSDGTVTNADWKCKTYMYGPTNVDECFRNSSVPTCKGEPPQSGCIVEYHGYEDIKDSWYLPEFDDTDWLPAREFTAEEVGWGVSPSLDEHKHLGLLDPQTVDWGQSRFIWRESLLYDNIVLCRYRRM